MTQRAAFTRRRLLAATLALPSVARAAFSADGPARVRTGAAKGVFLDLAQAGARLVAVGERGHVLLSDDQGQTWRQAGSVPTRTTLTCVHAVDDKTLWAAGHGGMILRSGDGGERWTIATGQADGPDVLLALRVEADGRGLAVGGFGVALVTADGGATWKAQHLLDGEAGDKHLNRIVVSRAGTWLIAAEGGFVLRSTDRGATWSAVKTPYAGSLWTGMPLRSGTLLFGGMRGNLVRSSDDGRSWTHRAIAGAGSLVGAAALADGRPALVGVDGTLVWGDAAGEYFQLQRLDDRSTLTAAVALPTGLVVASVAGLRRVEAPR